MGNPIKQTIETQIKAEVAPCGTATGRYDFYGLHEEECVYHIIEILKAPADADLVAVADDFAYSLDYLCTRVVLLLD